MTVIGIDPGPTESAMVVWAGSAVQVNRLMPNEDMLALIRAFKPKADLPLVLEQVVSYGMSVGKEVFETVFWTGRFFDAYGGGVYAYRIPRLEVKLHHCYDSKAKDTNIRQAIVDRFGGKEKAIGRKAAPGPLFGISSHSWSALAIALCWYDRHGHKESCVA